MGLSSPTNGSGQSAILDELYRIGLALTSELDVDAVLRMVGDSARRLLGADSAVCYEYNAGRNTYHLASDRGSHVPPSFDRVPREEGPTAEIIRTRAPLYSNDPQHEPPFCNSPFTSAENIESVLGLPLLKGDEVVGVLYINYLQPNLITETARRNGQLLASQAAVAIYNARLVNRLSDLVNVVRRTSEAIPTSATSSATPILKVVLDQIVELACELTRADCVVFYPYNSDRDEFYDRDKFGATGTREPFVLSDKPRSNEGMAGFVRREGRVIRNNVALEDRDMLKSAFIRREQIQAFVGICVRAKAHDLGVLYVNFRSPHHFTADEIRVIELFAEQAAVTIQVARLLELEQTERVSLEMLELMNDIGSALSHRLSNIAGTIPLEAGQVKRRLAKLGINDPAITASLSRIEEDTRRLLDIAVKLPEVKKLQGTPEATDVNKTLRSIVAKRINPTITLSESLNSELPITYVPMAQLGEVFDNIVSNAVQYMPNGGTLAIATRLLSHGRMIEVQIGDTGPGMDEAKQRRVFELFFGERKGGLGFGLWWSRRFMKHLGGDITVTSQKGHGSIFYVLVPVMKEHSRAAQPTEQTAPSVNNALSNKG